MRKLLPVIVFPALASGCALNGAASGDISGSYFSQQAYVEKTPMELWVDMRRESEVKEVFVSPWAARLKKMEAGAASGSKRSAKMNLAKSKENNMREKESGELQE